MSAAHSAHSAQFAPFAAKMRAAALPETALRAFQNAYAQLLAGESAFIRGAELAPVGALPHAAEIDADQTLHAAGRAALPQTAALKLNGGLATTMGLQRAKSLLQVKPGVTFLDAIARQARRQNTPVIFMNSFRTHAETQAALKHYGKLSAGLPAAFLQHKAPRIHAETFAPVQIPKHPDEEWAPMGHGNCAAALHASGVLQALQKTGRRYLFVANADNLGAALNPALLGWFAQSGAPFAMEVVRRTAAHRKGGHLARTRGGRLTLRELAQCPSDELHEFQDHNRYRYFNTNNLWLNLDALARALEKCEGVLPLPVIVNPKTLRLPGAKALRVLQLESALGAAIAHFEGALAVEVSARRFAPVKNNADLLRVRSDAYLINKAGELVSAAGDGTPPCTVELDDAYFGRLEDFELRFPKGPPSLAGCRSFRVRGDVHFGGGITARGDVALKAPAGETLHIPDGAVLQGGGAAAAAAE